MTDSLPQKIDTLGAQLEGLEAAADGLGSDSEVAESVRRIARALEASARALGLQEVSAGALAIQRAADAHLARSVSDFLARIEELRAQGPVEPATVLIVEDNRTVAAATTAYLRAPGRELVVAESAAEASSILASRPVDVVILDLILPDRDGRDVLVGMREQAATSTIPVIVLSSASNPVARAECLAVGADEFIVKPAEPRDLRSAVARQIRSSRLRRDAVRDGLTGLPNRAGITAEFEQRRRETTLAAQPLAVGVITIDSLAEVTMKRGRDAGDRFLLEVCAGIHEALGGRGLGRWETSELVAILPGKTDDESTKLLEGILRTLLADDVLAEYADAGIDLCLSSAAALVDADHDLRDAISLAERGLRPPRAEGADPDDHDELISLSTPRILLVEDDRVTATLLHHRLVRDGYQVFAFTHGSEAHDWSVEGTFDLAILDVNVPGMDGFELLSRLRAVQRFGTVPIIMLTAMGGEADVIRGLELGANDYMLKPFSPTELLARVRRHLNRRLTRPDPSTGDGARQTGELQT